jgi:type I restriction modification DNA specificity domain protein
MEFYHDILENLLDKLIDYRGKTPKKTLSGVPLVTAKIVKNGTINGYTEYIAEEDYDKWMVRGFPKVGDVILTTEAPLGEVALLKEEKVALAQRIVCLRGKDNVLDNTYLKYYLQSGKGQKSLSARESGTTVTGIKQAELRRVDIEYPAYDDQRRIASILSSLDRKIELNNKINADLEEMAQAIFKNWFVDFEPFKDGKFVDSELGMIPEGWKVGRLTEIASYMNGLAMQKFPPENTEDSLPVLKIKELGQGFCGTDSDRCSCNIKDECKIHNGDVIFSWSGTLLVDVWCGGDCGLNQHLFKVTSKDYPKWFYYYWTKHHLQEFIHIAKDKAVTMGHIKRGHLEEAMVAIPDNDSMEKAHELFEPILSKMISLRLESSRLSLLRDTLLPRLMSGEIEVPE